MTQIFQLSQSNHFPIIIFNFKLFLGENDFSNDIYNKEAVFPYIYNGGLSH